MDFRLDDEQLELQDTVRRFCAARFARADRERDGQPSTARRGARWPSSASSPARSRGAAARRSAWSRRRSSSSSSARIS
jgi:alkylation response protein AidB-like acyl-CoA dehydrogenase